MKPHSNYIFFFLLLIIQQKNIISQDIEPHELIEEINLNYNNYNEKKYNFSYDQNQIENKNIIHIITKTDDFSNPVYLYASFDEKVSEDNRIFSSQNIGTNELYINLSKYNQTKLYILAKIRKEVSSANVNLTAKLIDKIELTDENRKARFKLSHNSNVYYKVPNSVVHDSILIYGKGNDWDFFNMEVKYKSKYNTTVKSTPKQMIDAGFGIILDLNKIAPGSEINITVTKANKKADETLVEIGFEIAGRDNEYKRSVHILEHIYGATNSVKNCYQMIEEGTSDKKPIILINAFTQAITFVVYNADNTINSTHDSFDNSYIRLPLPLNNDKYFCIKKHKNKDTDPEYFMDISYEFQIFYEEDLPNIQMLLMPLINGKFYKYSLKKDSIMVYRHSTFSKYGPEDSTHIYTANLFKIKGNPKLYGYSCSQYPHCNINKTTNGLEEVKPINLYYVNKRQDAIGNTELNENGELLCDSRKQYLSVVKCESDDECEYTIEINNENEDIRLIPDNIYATTIYPGQNYFSILVSNHIDYSNMNISLTILTGNAMMSIYSDFDLMNEIKNYKYHKLFRKQVFEFKDTEINEYYWGSIECSETAFIELKYVTDFHSKGYIPLNPGEVNIEFINKKNDLFPYTIINPYNSNLLSNKVDRYYWFKIWTKECSILYNNENSQNSYEINEEFKEVDNNYKYTFNTTVNNYKDINNDDLTDCTMFVINGERDSMELPLLIISDYAIPFNFEKNNFIYPFINDENFKGIIIDIRFTDANIENPSYNISLLVNNSIIINETINKDKSIFINSINNDINCLNYSQCSFLIQVNKNSESDKAYNLTIKVYSGDSSNIEIIDSNETKDKIYVSKDGYKINRVSINKDEEAQYNFKFSSGQGNIMAVLINKNQNYDISTIFKDDSSKLLNYDSNQGILRIKKEDTKKCKEGCHLLMKLAVNNANNDLVEISFEKTELKNEDKNEKDDKKKLDVWLAVVLIIVCVLIVAGALVSIYFFVLRKKQAYTPPFRQYNNFPKSQNSAMSQRGMLSNNKFNWNNKFIPNVSNNAMSQRGMQSNNNFNSNNRPISNVSNNAMSQRGMQSNNNFNSNNRLISNVSNNGISKGGMLTNNNFNSNNRPISIVSNNGISKGGMLTNNNFNSNNRPITKVSDNIIPQGGMPPNNVNNSNNRFIPNVSPK